MLIFIHSLLVGEYSLYIIFALTCWFIWTVRFLYSRGYKPYRNEISDPKVTILIPTFNESREVLEECIRRVLASRINGHRVAEIILVTDEREIKRRSWLAKFPALLNEKEEWEKVNCQAYAAYFSSHNDCMRAFHKSHDYPLQVKTPRCDGPARSMAEEMVNFRVVVAPIGKR